MKKDDEFIYYPTPQTLITGAAFSSGCSMLVTVYYFREVGAESSLGWGLAVLLTTFICTMIMHVGLGYFYMRHRVGRHDVEEVSEKEPEKWEVSGKFMGKEHLWTDEH